MFKTLKNIIMFIIVFLIVSCGSDRAGNDTNSTNDNRVGVLGVNTLFPNAIDDKASTDDNQMVLIDVLSNDILDNNTRLSLNVMPRNGTILLEENKIIYTPNSDFIGLDNFSYTLSNVLGEQDSANVQVSVGIGKDSDGDGFGDKDELALGTDPKSSDSDGDGLSDGEEFYIYDTNATNPDSDNDGLKDGEEIKRYDSNATNPDTDGDCLLDSFEVLNYETNVTNADTDGDNVPDGVEVYGDKSCLIAPETLEGGVNSNPEKDNVPNDGTDVIDALDPNSDRDGDGLGDKEEFLLGTDPYISDSDGDGLSDGEEFYIYDTNATNSDSDNDGLKDGEEIKRYDSNATNPDTDGDCLLDSFEVLNYETNVTNADTDGDNVPDGIEIYGNEDCLTSSETLAGGENENPKKDNIPNDGTDVIDALDPNNDSDGDGQANSFENNCSIGNPLDADKKCIYLIESEEAKEMSGLGYAYIPGGFDVDGDGINETGFWMSRYQARGTDNLISIEEVMDTVGIVNQYISSNFRVVNRHVSLLSYSESKLDPKSVLAGSELLFDEQQVTGSKRISQFTAYLAEVCMSKHKLITSKGKILDLNVTLPSHKQYIHVKKLLDADKASGGDGRHIRNGILGVDRTIPIFDYTIVIDEFGETKKEYVRNLVQLVSVTEGDRESLFNFEENVPEWWEADRTKFRRSVDGASSTQDLGFGIGLTKDPYAVIVRGGDVLDLTLGVSGADTDGESDSTGVSFRAATPYFK